MTEFRGIPVRVTSGSKVERPQGHRAIKDGQKPNAASSVPIERKPPWLRVKASTSPAYDAVRRNVREHRLATVCEESKCPNIGECWSHGTATLMLMGDVCTRACRFCAVDTGNPRGWLDADEPRQSAESVRIMNLQYVVLTSVDRDDLPDGGAAHYAACVKAIHKENPQTRIEVLTPDFQGRKECVEWVVESGIDVFAQNLETVERLTHVVRDRRAGYRQTLEVLAHAKQHRPEVLTKSSLMLGLGETAEEVEQAMDDLRSAQVDILTLGQYLRPTIHHLPVSRFVPPEEFDEFRRIGLAKGFMEVASGPLVRSSYRADRVFEGNNLGLQNSA